MSEPKAMLDETAFEAALQAQEACWPRVSLSTAIRAYLAALPPSPPGPETIEALREAYDFLSAEHQNYSTGDWDDPDAREVSERIARALSKSALSEAITKGERTDATPSPVAAGGEWPIDTDDQVEALARECAWNNRQYMTTADYSIWCGQMRKFARLAAPPAPREA